MNFNISKMTILDLELIENNLQEDFDDFWNNNILKSELENSNSYYVCCKIDDVIVGFGGIWFSVDEAHITNIVTRKDKRNLGIASKILEELIQISKDNKKDSITLEVRESNIPAIRLYRKYDFDEVGIRKNYYDGSENAIIMTLLF